VHPLLWQRGRLIPYLVSWTPLAGILAYLLYLTGPMEPLQAAALAAPMALFYAFLCLSSWYVCKAVPLSRDSLPRIAVSHLLAALLSSGLWAAMAATIASGVALVPDWEGLPDLLNPRAMIAILVLGVFYYLLVVALHYVLLSIETSREGERREGKLRLLAREAELNALKAQVNPHFFFNSLNAVSSLTTVDPAKARETCLLLAEFLRTSLGLGQRTSIPLSEELALARRYLGVERVRFGARLGVEEAIEPSAGEGFVPPLLLQPLVENAVTHGVSTCVDGGVVRIEAGRVGERLRIVLRNPFDPDAPSRRGTGLGLSNVKARLAALYGREASLQETVGTAEYRVELLLPFETSPA